MYTYEQRKKAVDLHIKYDFSPSSVIRELGYPDKGILRKWYMEFVDTGDLHKKFNKPEKHSAGERKRAIQH